MGLRQEFRFKYNSVSEVQDFLLSLSNFAVVNSNENFFVFSNLTNQPEFTFDCEVTKSGIASDRAGNYFNFLGVFIESLTGRFGKMEVEDL